MLGYHFSYKLTYHNLFWIMHPTTKLGVLSKRNYVCFCLNSRSMDAVFENQGQSGGGLWRHYYHHQHPFSLLVHTYSSGLHSYLFSPPPRSLKCSHSLPITSSRLNLTLTDVGSGGGRQLNEGGPYTTRPGPPKEPLALKVYYLW